MRFRSAPDAGAQEVRSGSRFDRYSVYCSKDLQIAAHSVDELRSVLYNTIAYTMRYCVDSMYIGKNGRFYGQMRCITVKRDSDSDVTVISKKGTYGFGTVEKGQQRN